MAEHHYIVYERDSVWQFTFRGHIVAPFKTRSDAIAAAIAQASDEPSPGVEVVVQDRDMQQETVWRGNEASSAP